MYSGSKNINCNLNANEMPKNINDFMYFSSIKYMSDIIKNAEYIESHCAQAEELSITVGANNIKAYVSSCIFLFFISLNARIDADIASI